MLQNDGTVSAKFPPANNSVLFNLFSKSKKDRLDRSLIIILSSEFKEAIFIADESVSLAPYLQGNTKFLSKLRFKKQNEISAPQK